jgi:glycosyltransferase involved in cell wall biosynthesis
VQQFNSVILHDYFEIVEGGGRLCIILAQAQSAALCYGFKFSNHPLFQHISLTGRQHDLQSYSSLPVWKQLKLSLAFANKTKFLKDYDKAMYSGFYAPLAVHNHLQGLNIYYCHTPPRFIYDLRDYCIARLPFWQRPILEWFINYLKPRYEAAVAQMDIIVANSENVRNRIAAFLGKEAIIVYPPCDTESFIWCNQSDYYLSTARLDPLKRVDRIVKAFLKLPDKKLIITSGGSEYARLTKLARNASNITFTGWVAEDKLRELIGNAIATIYIPKDEDFGMTPVESMAAGKPVIGTSEGGLRETIVHGETGLLLSPDVAVEELMHAVALLTKTKALEMRRACEERAQLFSKQLFIDKMNHVWAGQNNKDYSAGEL